MIGTEVITEILSPPEENVFEQNGQTRKQIFLHFQFADITVTDNFQAVQKHNILNKRIVKTPGLKSLMLPRNISILKCVIFAKWYKISNDKTTIYILV